SDAGNADPIIVAHDLAVAFPSESGSTNLALRGVDLTVNRGETVCLIGPSGCGKSTFLNVAAGLLAPSFGTVLYDGHVLHSVNDRVGYITQQDNLLPWRTVIRNVEIGLEIAGVPKRQRRSRAMQTLDLV